MKAMQNIIGWLNAVKADRRLPASSTCFKVAFQLSQKTNSAEFRKSGQLVTWQSEVTIAKAIGMSERTVRNAMHLLRDAGYLAIKAGHGPGSSNRYILQNRQPSAAFTLANTGNRLPHSDEQKRQSGVTKAAAERMKTGSRLPPNSIISPREPRRAEDALGPIGAKLRQRIGEDDFKAWLSKARFVSQTGDGTLTLAAPTTFRAQEIANRFERPILDSAPGATRLVVVAVAEADARERKHDDTTMEKDHDNQNEVLARHDRGAPRRQSVSDDE